MSAHTFHLAVLILELHISDAQSLKSKRQVLRSIKDRIPAKFNVSLAEIGDLDKWQRATLGISAIGNDKPYLDSAMQKIVSFVESTGDVIITHQEIQFV